jgi:cysteinyl-tRNA synthetase
VNASEASEESYSYIQHFFEAMDADLNVSAALAVVYEIMAYSRKESMLGAHKKFVKMLEETFGCLLLESSAVDADALALARERDAARARKDFAESDRLRDVLMKMGYEVRDSKEGTQVKRK